MRIGKLLQNLAVAFICLVGALSSGMLSNKALAQCPVNAAFTSSTVYVCQGSTVSFTNTSTGGAVFYGWFENTTGFAATTNTSRVFNTPGQFLISLIASNGSCTDTATTIIVVDPDVSATSAVTNASCFGFSDGAVNLTPAGGTPNIAYINNRTATNWSNINSVATAGWTSGITLECWAKPDASWTTSDGMIVGINSVTGTNRFLFGYNAAQQRFVYFDDIAANRFQAGTSARGQWHHVVLSITAAKVVTMYVNGVNVLTYTTGGNCIPLTNDLFSIGQEFDGLGVVSQHFDGALDELRIWNTVLTPATVASNFATCGPISGAHPNINNLIAYYSFNEGAGTFLFDRSGRNNHGTRVLGTSWTTPALTNYGCFSQSTGYAYTWSTGAVTEDLSARPAGSYMCTITDGAGCTEIATAVVGQPVPVVVNLSTLPNDSVCIGDSTTITATGASTYTWAPGSGLSATTGSSVFAFPSSLTTYTIIGTDATGCKDTVTQAISVLGLPTAAISGTSVACFGDTATLNASGGTGYQWSSGGLASTELVVPPGTTTYSVTVTDQYGCQDTAQFPVLVNPLPLVGFSGIDTLCAGDSTTLTASGGQAYTWSNSASTASTTVTPAGTTTYSVTVTDANTCSSTDSIQVVVNPLPVISFTGPSSICLGATANITVNGGSIWFWSTSDTTQSISVSPGTNTTYSVMVSDSNTCMRSDSFALTVLSLPIVTVTGGDTICFGDSLILAASGAATYLWNSGATTSSIVSFPPNNSIYTVVGTDSNGCASADTAYAIVNSPPAISISGPNSICEGNSAQFMASGGTQYTWSTGATGSSLLVSPLAGTYTYIVTVTNNEGCTNNASIGLTVNPSPNAAVSGTTSICVGGSSTLTATGGGTYSWSTGATTASITVTPASTNNYTVTVTSGGCTDTASTTVVVNPLPATPFITQTGNSLSVASGLTSYQWFLNGNPISGANSNTYSPPSTGTYSVQVIDANGCSATSANYDFTFVGIAPGLDLLNQAQVYPNPNQGSFVVSMELDKRRDLEFAVYDVVGHLVYQQSMKASAGSFQQDIQLVEAKGVYFLHIRSGAASVVKKVVVE